MSFTDEYLEQKKKKKKEEQKKTGHAFTDEYLSKVQPRVEEDIAPVRTTATKSSPAKKTVTTDEKRTWFNKGAFEDGYQFGDISKTILGTTKDIRESLYEGVIGIAEKTVDAGAYVAGGVGGLFGADEFKNKTKEFIKKDLINEEKVAKVVDAVTGGGVSSIILGTRDADNVSILGEKSDSLLQSGGQLAGTIGLQAVGVPWFVTTGVTSFGSEVESAFNQDAAYGEAGLSAAITAGAEILTEKISGGISYGGKTLDDAITKRIARGVSNKVVRTLSKLGMDMAGEGAEEVLSGAMSAIGQKITYADDKELTDLFSKEDALESFIGGAVLGGGMGGINAVKSSVQGVDYASGLTANEKKVVDKVYEDRVAEAEKDGKITEKQKSKIYDEVLRDMDNGYISTDTIEEVLGGDTYKSYKDTVDSEDALAKEYEELGKKKNATLAEQSRYGELKQQLDEIKQTSQRDTLKTKLGEEVFGLVQGDRLVESYNERGRRSQAFEADLTKYDQKQQATIKKAVESGILNNTRRTHEFVDMIAKISADKGVLFDFTNNEKLKGTSFAVDGKTVNGFVTKDGVTLNIDSAKSLNSVVGHEITHVLEGTDLYGELQSAVMEYAKTKKDYRDRVKSVKDLYKNIDGADYASELTADLVGDYLFTDPDFINNLSTNHMNVFQKIYDEIKYLCKVATAGSKEARELEKVKRAFEKAYRDGGKTEDADNDVSYSLVEDQETIDFLENQDYITTYKAMVQIDGKLYPPMASQTYVDEEYTTKSGEKKTRRVRKLKNPSVLGKWQQSDERPDLVTSFKPPSKKYPDGYGQFDLLKSNGKTTGGVAYNPYEHTSNIVLNDQFAEAYQRPELVTVEYHIPVSELTSGYKAQYAKDPVGLTDWKAGGVAQKLKNSHRDVYLTRWSKPVRVLPDSEVAQKYKEILDKEEGISVPWNVVTPSLREELEKVGVPIDYSDIKAGSTIRTFDAFMRGEYDKPKKSKKAKYSVSDSNGRQLTSEQQEYFKDSKARDKDGNLLTLYHGTQSKFTVFDLARSGENYDGWSEYGEGIYLTPSKKTAEYYGDNAGWGREVKVMELYADLRNPFNTTEEVKIDISDLTEKYNLTEGDERYIKKYGYRLIDFLKEKKESVYSYLSAHGYDGVWEKTLNGVDQIVVYAENQVKNTDNLNPTKDVDIRYSVSDSDGKKLTKEQSEFFKDSKMRNDNGELMVMYHGSQDAGFHVFDAKMSDDDTSFFFVDRNDVAATYSGTEETYEARTIRTVEDMNKFLAEIDYDHYKAVEKNGKFELLENNEHVATKDTMQEIYEEFCWYEGVGDGDANYKVYLNLKNPLIVDAQDRNWDNISREFSQEVADKYNALTSEEKTALTQLAAWEDMSIFRDEIEQATDGALASAYEKLGGEDANMYDMFTIASENFSDEAIKQFAVKQMKTRDYAKRAKEKGYDGVIFKNIHDNGGYSNGSEGASTVAIAFESNQIKSVANEKPTADKDIRYSLTEYTDDEKKAHNKAVVDHFGKTYNWAETGYVLLDGTKLDLSGKHEGAPGGYRTVDHRDIVDALGSDYGDGSYSGSLVQFMSEGNIRISPESNGINLSVKPTKAQEQALSAFISRARGEVLLDIDGLDGYTEVSVEYPRGTHANKVLNDIREWFDSGKKPEVPNLSPFRYSVSGNNRRAYGTYNVYGKDIALTQEETQVGSEEVLTSAPVSEVDDAENATTTEPVTQYSVGDILPDDLAPMQAEIDKLQAEKAKLETRMLADPNNTELEEQWWEIQDKINALSKELAADESARLDSLSEEDIPPEMEAPVGEEVPFEDGQAVEVEDPFENREVPHGNEGRKVNAYMYDNPEVRPYFQAEAYALLDELNNGTKGEKWYNDKLYYDSGGEQGFGGTKRHQSESIDRLSYEFDLSYDEIEKGLNAIIEDHGAENIAAAKKIEFVINDRLMHGYKPFGAMLDPEAGRPNQDYIALMQDKQRVDSLTDDAYAPPISEEIAPVKETPKKDANAAIRPKREKQPKLAKATPEEQARAEILVEEPKVDKKKQSAWSMVKNMVLDKGMVFEDLSLATGNRELQARWNSIRYAEGKAQRKMEKALKPIIDTVEKSGKTKQFYEYLYHLHNADRMTLADRYDDVQNKPVFGDSVTAEVSLAEANKLLKANPEFKRWAGAVYSYNRQNREMLVESGVISREVANLWEEMYPHYVPIRRVGDTGLNINVPLDTGRTGVNAPIKRATGGSRDILPLFDTMGQRTMQTYKAIAKNRFGVELKNTLRTTIADEDMSIDEAIDGVDAHEELLQEGKNGKKPTFTVFENGKKVTFEITDEMYASMKPTSEGLAYTNKFLNGANNLRRGLLTEYNPAFMLTNPIKDTQDVLINSQHPARTYANYPRAVAELIGKRGRWYQEYMDNGGERNTYFEKDTNTFAKEKSAIRKIVGFPLDKISDINNFIERVPRLAEYIASRKAGQSVDVAMLDAARVTTNFAAGGDLTKFANRNGFTFLNASVQGFVQQVRNVREAKANGLKGVLTLATKLAAAGLPAMLLNHLLWDDDEEYAELSDYVKQNYYIVGKYDDGKFVRIPKGRALAVIQNAFEQMENLITGDDEVDLATFGELVLSNLAPNNPLENHIFAPIAQAWSNRTWYGDDLVPTRLQDLPAAEQYDETTDEISKWLGEKTNLSPYKLNYLLDQYSGGVGDMLLPRLTLEAERGDNSMIAPLADKFTTDGVLKNQNISDFYDTMDELTTNAKSSKATDEDVLKQKYMNSVNSELSELYAQKREIQNSDLPDAEKYEEVRMIQQQIVDLTRNSLNSYEDVSIEGRYARVGNVQFRWYEPGEDSTGEPGWRKLTDKQSEKQDEVTSGLGIDASEYWSNKEEYDYAYEYPEKYAVAKSVGGYEAYKGYSSELYDIKADKDENGDSIRGSRKEKVIDWMNNLDADYGTKIILFKSEYNADDTYNYDIIEYLNSREDISYEEMETILKELGFDVSSDGTISW